MTRPSRETVLALLAADGQTVTLRESELTTDVDGDPLGVETTESTAVLVVSLDMLGWTREELRIEEGDE